MSKKKTPILNKFIIGGILILLLFYIYQNKYNILRFSSHYYYKVYYSIFSRKQVDQSKNLKNFGIKIPKKYSVHGIDVSKYQMKINWDEVVKMRVDCVKISFAYIKATEGGALIDRLYDYNWENAKKHNVIRGAYHFYRPNVNSKIQANLFTSIVTLEKGDLPPVLDIEVLGSDVKNTVKGIKNWLKIVEKKYEMKPIVYTNIDFYNKYLKDNGIDSYPLWIAHYYEDEIDEGFSWYFWQHNDGGKVNGIAGDVDFNVFNGNMNDLRNLCKK